MTEDLLLDKTLEVLDTEGYEAAYSYLMTSKEQLSDNEAHASLYYFLTCLAAGSGKMETALNWLEEAICQKGYWYRTEMLEDDDLAPLFAHERYIEYKILSEKRLNDAQTLTSSTCTWTHKKKENLLLCLHGNGENAQIAKAIWSKLENDTLQVETIQSSRVHAYGRFRWHYDDENYKEPLGWINKIEWLNYNQKYLGGFSAGCDMILRLLTLSDTSCDAVFLQSPWTPFIETHSTAIAEAFKRKNITVHIYCGTLDEDSLIMASALTKALITADVKTTFERQEGLRHQFPDAFGNTYI
jgi:hypothetical protein